MPVGPHPGDGDSPKQQDDVTRFLQELAIHRAKKLQEKREQEATARMSDQIRLKLIATLPDRLKQLVDELSSLKPKFRKDESGVTIVVDDLTFHFQIVQARNEVWFEYVREGLSARMSRELTNEALGKGLRKIILDRLRAHFDMPSSPIVEKGA
jgi:hypothetical protein